MLQLVTASHQESINSRPDGPAIREADQRNGKTLRRSSTRFCLRPLPSQAWEKKKKKMPMIHAALIGAAQDALKRDLKALSFLTGLARSFDQSTVAGNSEAELTSDDQSLIAEFLDRKGKAKDVKS